MDERMSDMNRRNFLKGTAWMGAAALAGCRSLHATASRNGEGVLNVFISDLHVGGANVSLGYTHDRLAKVVDEVLALDPKPANVVCFGDVALSYGLGVDYDASKPILQRLVDADIKLTLALGNHDRRIEFLKRWPAYRTSSPVPGRVVSVVDLGFADLVLLDALKGADDRPQDAMGPVDGLIDDAQVKWLKSWMASAERPFFLGSHQFRDLTVEGCATPLALLEGQPLAAGWIYGHDHVWCPDVGIVSWSGHDVLPTLALPSTGLWGDIGYVKFWTSPDGARAELVQDDFYFQTPTARLPRPAAWDARVRDNQGACRRFCFETVKS